MRIGRIDVKLLLKLPSPLHRSHVHRVQSDEAVVKRHGEQPRHQDAVLVRGDGLHGGGTAGDWNVCHVTLFLSVER